MVDVTRHGAWLRAVPCDAHEISDTGIKLEWSVARILTPLYNFSSPRENRPYKSSAQENISWMDSN